MKLKHKYKLLGLTMLLSQSLNKKIGFRIALSKNQANLFQLIDLKGKKK